MRLRTFLNGTTGRCAVAMTAFAWVAVFPYALFVKFVALRGVENLSETVPGDYYFIRDASVSLVHLLSWDLAGIMDKIQFGDYLAKVPRVSNMIYTVILLVPFVVPWVRRSLFPTRRHRQLLGVILFNVGFAAWATVGYAEPGWLPTFHRSLAATTRAAYATDSVFGNLTLAVSSTIVQVLRFPHRFQLTLFALAPALMTLSLAWGIDRLMGRRASRAARPQRTGSVDIVALVATGVALGTMFFGPFLSNEPYRQVYGSGDFNGFAAAYPVDELAEVKQALEDLPQGKTVVLPPTETAKLVVGSDGVAHKFIDKFYIYYLDQPSFYYGLTGDSVNKFEFFLLLRSLYYQQDWWVNVARDIGLEYIVLNKQVEDNRGVGAEYLPDIETYLREQIEAVPEHVSQLYENDSFVLYRLDDTAPPDREVLLFDTSWQDYLDAVFTRLDLSRCYDFQYISDYDGVTDEPTTLLATDERSAAIDIWAREHQSEFFVPSSKIFAFNPDVVASSYYLSPMFRLFLFFSDTKWNRTEMITPGIFGTLRGSFIGVPRSTRFTIPTAVTTPGRYRVLMRGGRDGQRPRRQLADARVLHVGGVALARRRAPVLPRRRHLRAQSGRHGHVVDVGRAARGDRPVGARPDQPALRVPRPRHRRRHGGSAHLRRRQARRQPDARRRRAARSPRTPTRPSRFPTTSRSPTARATCAAPSSPPFAPVCSTERSTASATAPTPT